MNGKLRKLFTWLQGRTTAFCIAFFVSGNVLQLIHKLDANYVMFMTALLGAVIGHSIKEDHMPDASAASAPSDPDSNKG